MDLRGQKVVVVGLGESGLAAVRLLVRSGAVVTGNDVRDDEALAARAREAGAEVVLGGHPESLFAGVDRIVVSPGVPPLAVVEAAAARGVPVASEVELASWFMEGTVIGITGTNGKSTVTSLVGAMCEASGRPTFVGGNLGTPLVDAVDSPAAKDGGFVVVELSSFQLERVDRFRAHVALLLNVTDDHLDRYDSFASYAAAKGRIFHGQRREDHAVIPAGDALVESLARAGAARLHRFGGDEGEVRVVDGHIVDRAGTIDVPTESLAIRGRHNVDNACAAALAALLAGIDGATITGVLREFAGLPHRMQLVRALDDVVYYDDSKATNVGAAVAALEGFEGTGRAVLIAGGKDKGGSYEALVAQMRARGRAVVLIGEAAETIEAAFAGSGVPTERAVDLDAAVGAARRLAQPGDIVLLAPACSSFDMFRSYAERGDRFQSAVHALDGGTTS